MAVRRARRTLLATLLLVACSRNPATGRLQFALPSDAEEIELGRSADAEVHASMPTYDEQPAVRALVAEVGARLSAHSERAGLPWQYTVLDEPAVNAFALPGGFVYVTRGLLAHLESTDELAAVLAHETGHVTARHGVVQLRKQATARRSVGIFRVIDPNLQHIGGFAARTAGLALLAYSREDEHEADDLAIRYVDAAGFRRDALVRVFAVLTALARRGGDQTPQWLSTHPDPAERQQRTAAAIHIDPAVPPTPEPAYLQTIAGLAFGEDPRDGYLLENLFVHPRGGFELELPAGWKVLHDREQVLAVSPDEHALFMTMPTKHRDREVALGDFFRDSSMTGGQRIEGRVGGLPFTSQSFAMVGDDGVKLMGLVAFVDHAGRVMAMVAIGPEQDWGARADLLARSFASFSPIREPARAAVGPARIEVVALPRAMTLDDAARELGGITSADGLALLNGVQGGVALPSGYLLKQVRAPGPTQGPVNTKPTTP